MQGACPVYSGGGCGAKIFLLVRRNVILLFPKGPQDLWGQLLSRGPTVICKAKVRTTVQTYDSDEGDGSVCSDVAPVFRWSPSAYSVYQGDHRVFNMSDVEYTVHMCEDVGKNKLKQVEYKLSGACGMWCGIIRGIRLVAW